MPPERLWTILDLLQTTTTYFENHLVSPARLTAELLLAHALKIRRLDLYLRYDQPCSPQERDTFRQLIKRRVRGEPTQYITGQVEFWSLPLHVDARVLIPRPDTEVLVEEALSFARSLSPQGEGLIIADIGTGSGAVALALKKELPQARIFATDKDPDALAVARKNAETLDLAVEMLQGDLTEPLPRDPFDLIVSNPPYIPSSELPKLPPEVGQFEPKTALDGGEDGLVLVSRLFQQAPPLLKPKGALLCEISPEQSERALQIAQEAGFSGKIRKDYEGRDRVVVATLTEQTEP